MGQNFGHNDLQPGMVPTNTAPVDQLEPGARIREFIWGFISSQVLGAVAAFGIPDVLSEGPRDSRELAERLHIEEERLYRLLRAAASIGILDETAPRVFALNEVGELLRSDVSGSLSGQAVAFTDPWQWSPWAYFRDAIRTGESPIHRAFGGGLFDYLAKHPEEEMRFAAAMGNSSDALVQGILRSYDFSTFRRIVDVGGSHGHLLAAILQGHNAASGIVFDQPSIVPHANHLLRSRNLADRSETVGGDFFKEVPAGGDLYILKMIVHDWPDEAAAQILRNCRTTMAPAGRVMVIEGLMPPDGERSLRGHRSDLDMMVINGGKERTREEFEKLLDMAGLCLREIVPVYGEWALIIAEAA